MTVTETCLNNGNLVKPTWLKRGGVKQKPMDVNVTVGGSHTFVCDGEGKPAITRRWYINAKKGNIIYILYRRTIVQYNHKKLIS